MGRLLTSLALAAGVSLGSPLPAAAQDATARPWYEEITVSGVLSVTYSYNFNRPASATNQFRVFDFDDNTFKIDEVQAVVKKAVVKPGDAGFRVDAVAGQSVPRVTAAAGLFRDSNGMAQDFDIMQAFVSYLAPVGSGLRFDAGKFFTHHGYENVEGPEGWNDNATHSFLFGYAIPVTHTGLRASYAFSSTTSAMVMVVNGWDDAKDNNSSKSFGAQLALTPNAALSVYLNGMYGPERPSNNHDNRAMLDLVAVWKATRRLTLGLNLDHGSEPGAVVEGKTATWKGGAGYVRYGFTNVFSLALRGERFDDPDGARTGVPQRLTEWTLTPEYRATPHLVVRGDLRIDRSNRPVFEKENGFRDQQVTVGANVIYVF